MALTTRTQAFIRQALGDHDSAREMIAALEAATAATEGEEEEEEEEEELDIPAHRTVAVSLGGFDQVIGGFPTTDLVDGHFRAVEIIVQDTATGTVEAVHDVLISAYFSFKGGAALTMAAAREWFYSNAGEGIQQVWQRTAADGTMKFLVETDDVQDRVLLVIQVSGGVSKLELVEFE